MTTATLARGPPLNMSRPQEEDEDEDALMDEASDVGGISPGREEDSRANGLMIDDVEQDDTNSDDEREYSNGDVVDYSGQSHMRGRHPAGSSGSLSDGDGEQDNGNGSIQSYDEYQQGEDVNNGAAASSAYPGANMRRHRVRHSGIKPFECRFCQKRFFRKDHMREHMNHKHNNTSLECYYCQQVFDKEKDLFQHVTRDHDVNPRELHCQYCSFSATTIGRYLWHMTTSHPRKNAHYVDGTGEALSMAPYAMDANNEYESPATSPKVSQPSSNSREGLMSASLGQGRNENGSSYDYLSSGVSKSSSFKRECERERRCSRSPPNNFAANLAEHSSKYRETARYYESLEESAYVTPPTGRAKSGSGHTNGVRYVSILPNKFPSPASHGAPEDLTAAASTEDLIGAVPAGNGKASYGMVQRKMNGNAAFIAAAFAAAAVADSTGKVGGAGSGGGGSNRRKSKAPVRMTATPEESSSNGAIQASSSVVSSSNKRDRDLYEGARNGNDSGGHFAPILEEIMSSSHNPRGVGPNNFPEDLSSSSSGHSGVISTPRLPASLSQRNKVLSSGTDKLANEVQSRSPSDKEASEQKCPHCLIVYPDSVLYMLHRMLHSGTQPYRCAQCHVQFPNRYEFYAHIVNHGSPSTSQP
ncbi:hypothetical protein BV898_00020 [Hypsibius exemplaris]|uniref:C2H2-type domain-containing protein n=1 Tax=Hypsibius exemplaris TaxID=2072580 RepID=A0A1W0XEU2_HYPEX|nr:hypothetical protein BV898_00020 [Hypsibius exemplaris]